MLTFYWRWLKTAVTGAWGITSIATTMCAIGLAILVDLRPERAAWFNAVGGWIVPVTVFCSFFFARLLLAPFWLWREMADKVARFESAAPQIVATPMKSKASPKIRPNHVGQITAFVTISLYLENRGPGQAHNYEIAVYSCWLKNKGEWDKWSDEFFARWPSGCAVEYEFTQSKIAEEQGGGRVGFLPGDELVFVVEVTGRINAADGVFFRNESIWLSWDARGTRIVPPNEAIVKLLQPELVQFKAKIPRS